MAKKAKRAIKAKVELEIVELGPDLFYVPKRYVTLKKAVAVALSKDIQEMYATAH